MPTTDMNSPSRSKRFFSPPIRWSNNDIESQQTQQPVIHSFQDPSPQMHHSTDHPRDQNPSQHDSIKTPYSSSSYAVEDHDMQGPSTQKFAPNPRQTLTDIPTRISRSTSNPALRFPIPSGFTHEEDYSKSQSANQDSYFTPRRRCEDREIDLEGQYPSIQTPENHLEYDSDNSFGDRYRRTSDTHDQNSIPYFEHRTNESQNPYSNTQDLHQDVNSESTSTLIQRPRRRSHSGNGSSQAEHLFNPRDYTIGDIESQRLRAPKPPAIPIDLEFSGVIQTLRRPIDYFGANKEEMKEMWQCVPNMDLEEGMIWIVGMLCLES
ncbi:hypothetical protein BHYA_0223g00030 [Botrytis hyacinthi]|uniref:Uncharacterized protein n=1 Tax=Botrytis hyacinthi TaxID=278943 RepID=A0A4Z1GHB4_9HELO|nr:hypothetical protein BHYA_0223g00030 [Botrytis hyacinthi]